MLVTCFWETALSLVVIIQPTMDVIQWRHRCWRGSLFGWQRGGRLGAITWGWRSESVLWVSIAAFAAWQLWMTPWKTKGICIEYTESVTYFRDWDRRTWPGNSCPGPYSGVDQHWVFTRIQKETKYRRETRCLKCALAVFCKSPFPWITSGHLVKPKHLRHHQIGPYCRQWTSFLSHKVVEA